MSVQHKYRPQHLALAVALAVGCADFAIAQQIAAGAAVETPEELIATLDAFISSAPDTSKTRINTRLKDTDGVALQLDDRDDLVSVLSRGSFTGLVDGGGGDNVLQLDAPKGRALGETRNFMGLEVKQGEWSREGPDDFSKGVLVRPGAMLINDGSIKGRALTQGRLINNGTIAGGANVFSGGVLVNSGAIAGIVDVHENGSFAGKGTVGALNVHGLLSVDSVRGAPQVSGDMKLANTAVLAYQVSPDGRGETIKVDGTASLGGATLRIIEAPGDYPQTSRYTIIEAAKVDGRFGNIENNLAFMTATPDYSDKQAVRLTYARNEVPFEDLATNENSRELARSIEEPKASPTAQTPPNTANAAVSTLLASTTEQPPRPSTNWTAARTPTLRKRP
jgi:hypothetical protein